MRTLRPVSLHQRFGYSNGIETASNDSIRLLGCLICESALRCWCERPGNRVSPCRGRPLRQIHFLFHCLFNVTQLRSVGDRQSNSIVSVIGFDLHILGLKAGVFSSILHRDGITLSQFFKKGICLDAHHQMRATFEVKTEVNIVRKSSLDPSPGKISEMGPVTRAYDYIKAHEGNDDNNYRALE